MPKPFLTSQRFSEPKIEVRVEPKTEVKLRRISEDAWIKRDRREITPSMIKLSLERLVSPSEQNNVGSEATKVPQDSEKCNATKRVKCESKNTNDMVMEEEPEVMVMIVPYADLYNNEKDLIEASFRETSKKNEELGPMKLIDSRFYKTSRRFSIGK
ncbi:predicted protein [Arabidopsis lyrata subsp. lyrata]|uniref:Predicted protein n=1 Tax=Arabidopsis lyrata subsp. lyrata TaxID=81972 RepID=D7KYN2_ARALL|nr:predicted protein [Arabidopsis lyrata subsp. lyrata]